MIQEVLISWALLIQLLHYVLLSPEQTKQLGWQLRQSLPLEYVPTKQRHWVPTLFLFII